jgi:uncharacterized membrane protein YgcG
MMAYDIEQYTSRFQRIESSLPRGHETYALAVGLVGGLAFGAPLLGWALTLLGVPQPVPLLAGVAVVGGLYGLSILLFGRLTLGLCVSFVVTSTFAANVPLTAAASTYPGNLGPQVWLIQLPIICLFVLYGMDTNYSLRPFTKAEYAFGGFVLWSALSTVFGGPERPDTALYFTVFMLTVWLAFVIANRNVRYDIITLRQVVGVFLTAVCGHVAFAFAQFVNQGPFGLSTLGETGRNSFTNVIDLGMLGEYVIGVIISGLTGGSSPLSVLLVVAIPLVLGFAFKSDTTRHRRAISIFAAVSMITVLRLTGKDGSRGAMFIALGAFVIFYLWNIHSTHDSIMKEIRDSSHPTRVVSSALSVLLSLAILSYPSSKSGRGSGKVQLNSEDGRSSGSSGTGGTGGSGTGGTGGSGTGGTTSTNSGPVDISQITVPFFNLGSLGIRIQQYVAGVIMAFDRPLFGVGGANYPYVAPAYGLPTRLPSGILFPLHNVYIAILAETGFPGFTMYMLAVALVLLSGWRLFIEWTGERVFVIGVLAGMTGYLAASFWVSNVRFVNVLPFWLLMGAMVATTTTSERTITAN